MLYCNLLPVSVRQSKRAGRDADGGAEAEVQGSDPARIKAAEDEAPSMSEGAAEVGGSVPAQAGTNEDDAPSIGEAEAEGEGSGQLRRKSRMM